ncbi:MAG: ASPIC/UnbV domain protein [Ferruginibacter sp.]|nr:ASPIC/UnbV domain protein [Ferruginibacter sp.]
MFRAVFFSLIGCLFFLFTGCRNGGNKSVFTLLDSKTTGISFNNISVENEQINILTYEYMYNGGGVAIGDINNDGLKDIYFTSNNLENKLYLNRGNMKFDDITDKAGAGCKGGWKTGVTMVDINADGFLDIYICKSADGNPERRRNILLINNGNLTFTNKAKEYGLDDIGYSTQAGFFDYDNDGDMDMFLLNHSLIEVSNTIGINPVLRNVRDSTFSDKLFRNDHGVFTDVSETAGITGGMANYGLGIAISDINNDGWQDVYVTNDYAENDHIYINNKNGSFTDSAYQMLDHMSNFSMGVDIADFNNDGLQDICTLDMLPEDNRRQKLLFGPNEYDKFNMFVKAGLHYQYMRNMLQLNNGNGRFSEIGQLAGVSNTDWSWAPLIADFDNDSHPDLFISNGYKRDYTNMDFLKYKADVQMKTRQGNRDGPKTPMSEIIKKMPTNNFHNYIFKNNGDLTFKDVSKDWGLDKPVLNNGAAYADLDNDGDLDLVTNNIDQEAFIYKNNSNELFKNNYLAFRLKGEGQNRFGVGAKVKVFFAGQIAFKEVNPSRGFQSSVDFDLVIGLGKNTMADSVQIIWPLGGSEIIKAVKANQQVELSEKNAIKKYYYSTPSHHSYFLANSKQPVSFLHKEDEFIDFGVQFFLPGLLSTQGPRMAKADINGDGLEDIFVGGAAGQPGAVYMQDSKGNFRNTQQPAIAADSLAEDTDASFFDADGDGDPDLFVVSGGYVFKKGSPELQNRLYLNDGKGKFFLKPNAVANVFVNASCVRPADVDGDGDMDVFVGGRVIPGKYPETPDSYLLINDGKGNFTDKTEILATGLKKAGLVTDAVWADLNNDKQMDIIVVGEWMPIKVFINEKGKLIDRTSFYFGSNLSGWWNRIYAYDFDKDGDLDFIAGNRGLNTQVKVSADQPCTMLYKDFDGNGSIDGIMCYYIQGKSYPALSRDEMVEQMPALRKKFNDYASYSTATINDFFPANVLSSANKLIADKMATCYIENMGNGKFEVRELPVQAQFSPVYAINSLDVNKDGNQDLLLGGNFEKSRVSIGKFDANHGMLFLGDGKGNFNYVPQAQAGFSVKGDVRDIQVLKIQGKTRVLFSISDKPVVCYSLQ